MKTASSKKRARARRSNRPKRAARVREAPPPGFYLDASALAKLYLPEAESDELNRRLQSYRQTMISDLGITEVVSACARRRREGVLDTDAVSLVHRTILDAVDSGIFLRLTLDPAVHREAERLLMLDAVTLRAADALHLALATEAGAKTIVTYDTRLGTAARHVGLKTIP